MSWPCHLFFIRHAESEGNVLDNEARTALKVATHQYKLTERGRRQAEETAKWLATNDVVRLPSSSNLTCFQSYYERSRETMRYFLRSASDKPIEDARLAEAQRGIYHAMPKEALAARYPEELERKALEGLYHYRAPGGENWLDVELRIHSFLDMLRRDYAGKDVLIVGHGHWFLMFQKIVHGWSADEALSKYQAGLGVVPNASVTIYSGRSVVHETCTPWMNLEQEKSA